jgi:methyl-accepting chemotaxis protein
MDKVTQQNAANAEETASSSEELSAQATSLKDIVGDLVALVTGGPSGSGASPRRPSARTRAMSPARRVPGIIPASARPRQLAAPSASPKVMRPNVVIPLDGDDFKDF